MGGAGYCHVTFLVGDADGDEYVCWPGDLDRDRLSKRREWRFVVRPESLAGDLERRVDAPSKSPPELLLEGRIESSWVSVV